MENKKFKLKELIALITRAHPEAEIKYSRNLIYEQLKCVSITCKLSGVTGHGMDLVESLALEKAYSEYVERYCLHLSENSFSSNGYAAHVVKEYSKKNAFAELVERDALLVNWFQKIPPVWISESEFDSLGFSQVNTLNKRIINKHKIKIQIGIIAKTGSYFTVVGCVLDTRLHSNEHEFGLSVDTAASESLFEAILKCFHGACFAGSIIVARKQGNTPLYLDIDELDVSSTKGHFEYYLNPSRVPMWFLSNRNREIRELKDFDVELESVMVGFSTAFPIFVSRARGTGHQDFFVGKSTPEKVNVKRIMANFSINNELNMKLHPLP